MPLHDMTQLSCCLWQIVFVSMCCTLAALRLSVLQNRFLFSPWYP